MDGGNDMKVGFGDCYAPGPGGAQDHLRFLFLERVRVQCPAMLRELQENLKVHDGDKGYLSPFDDEVRLSWDPTVETESAFSKRARGASRNTGREPNTLPNKPGFNQSLAAASNISTGWCRGRQRNYHGGRSPTGRT